jgi:hypothetical protein
MRILMAAVSVSFVASAWPAFAATELENLQTYCKPDIERLCPTAPIGGGGIKDCLKAHEKEISVGCAQALKALKDG